MNLPAHHQNLMPYLILKNAKAFIEFTKNVFDATLHFAEKQEDGQTIRHAELSIQGATIMLAEATEQWKTQNANLFIYVENADNTYHTALNNSAASLMEPETKDYGRTCGVTDPFGNVWWITSL
jgi:PhnB protein